MTIEQYEKVKKPNIFTSVFNRLKNFIFPQATTQRVFGVETAVSQVMEQNINLWYSMYNDQPPWRTERVVPVGLPTAICREVARPTLAELKVNITGSQRAYFLSECFQTFQENLLGNLVLGLATGGMAFKPSRYGGEFIVDATCTAAFKPTKFSPDGTCVSGVFLEKAKVNGKYYVRLEYHDLTGNTYTIKNKAYHSDRSGSVGDEANLADVPEWADIEPEIIVNDVDGPLFAYFRTPQSNNIDTGDKSGISIYGGATVDLIRRADEQWELLDWEYRSGQKKIFMDGTATTAKDFDKRLFVIGPFSRDGNFYQEYAPKIRDDAIYRGFQNILKQIEFQVGLSFGTISDPQTVERTATEVRNSKQRMYVTIDSIQKALQHTFDALIYAMDVYASLYNLAPVGPYEVSYDWGDSVLDDEETKRIRNADMRLDVSSGLLKPELYVSKKYNVSIEKAKSMLPGMEEMADEPQNEVE